MARILLAEDDADLRSLLTVRLARAGHHVEAVGDGDAVLAALARDAFDLVVADLVMPGLDGLELARRINGSSGAAAMRIMFITGFAGVVLSRRANRCGSGRLSPAAPDSARTSRPDPCKVRAAGQLMTMCGRRRADRSFRSGQARGRLEDRAI